VASARRAVDDAEQRTDRELAAHVSSQGWSLFPSPRVHADLAPAPALAAPDHERAATLIAAGVEFRQRRRRSTSTGTV
jgi:hypothetical protein